MRDWIELEMVAGESTWQRCPSWDEEAVQSLWPVVSREPSQLWEQFGELWTAALH